MSSQEPLQDDKQTASSDQSANKKSEPAVKVAFITGIVAVLTTLITAIVAPLITKPSEPSSSSPIRQSTECNQLIFQEAFLTVGASYPGDSTYYVFYLEITGVNGSAWSGMMNEFETVGGTISGNNVSLRRRDQTWTGVCTKDGVSGTFTKDDSLNITGSFTLKPK